MQTGRYTPAIIPPPQGYHQDKENGKCCRYEIMVDESLLLWFYLNRAMCVGGGALDVVFFC